METVIKELERYKKDYQNASVGVYLRPMTYDDTDSIVDWRNRESVRSNFIYRGPFTKEVHENWIRTKVETGQVVQFMICELENDRPVGSVYIRDIDRVHNKAEYGIFIGEEDARGRGYGTAAAKLMLKYCFEEEKLHKVYLRLLAENLRARRSYEKAGFQQEAILHDEVMLDGVYRDVVFMAILKDWFDRK